MASIVAMSNGTLGIGTSVAQAPLHVVGNSLLVGNVNITGNIYPTACNVYDLGSSNSRFRDLYLSGNTINLGGTVLSRNGVDGSLTIAALPVGGGPAQPTNVSGASLIASSNISTPQITSACNVIDFSAKGLSNVGSITTSGAVYGTILTASTGVSASKISSVVSNIDFSNNSLSNVGTIASGAVTSTGVVSGTSHLPLSTSRLLRSLLPHAILTLTPGVYPMLALLRAVLSRQLVLSLARPILPQSISRLLRSLRPHPTLTLTPRVYPMLVPLRAVQSHPPVACLARS